MTEKNNVTLEELKKISETSELIAREIRMLSRAFKKIASGGLRQETIVLLLHASSGVGKPHIRKIMQTLPELERDYLRSTDKNKVE